MNKRKIEIRRWLLAMAIKALLGIANIALFLAEFAADLLEITIERIKRFDVRKQGRPPHGPAPHLSKVR
jgi:hypothetical protein